MCSCSYLKGSFCVWPSRAHLITTEQRTFLLMFTDNWQFQHVTEQSRQISALIHTDTRYMIVTKSSAINTNQMNDEVITVKSQKIYSKFRGSRTVKKLLYKIFYRKKKCVRFYYSVFAHTQFCKVSLCFIFLVSYMRSERAILKSE